MTDNEITFKKKISKSKIERNNELRIKEDSDEIKKINDLTFAEHFKKSYEIGQKLKELNDIDEEKNEKKEKKPESTLDKYLFFLYTIIFIFLVSSAIDVTLNNQIYTSLKNNFDFTGIDTSRTITVLDVSNSVINTINTLFNSNLILQVFYILFRKNSKFALLTLELIFEILRRLSMMTRMSQILLNQK